MRVIITGPVDDITGYATVTREIALAFHRLGAEVSLWPVPWAVTKAELPAETSRLLDSFMVNQGDGDCFLYIGLPFLLNHALPRPAVALTMLEVDTIPSSWVTFCNRMDEVWVPSRFNEETFRRSGVEAGKIRVMPLGVDTDLFTPGGRKLELPGVPSSAFVFLSVFEWVPRKGYDILLTAYLEEFRAADNVCLVLRTNSNNTSYDPEGKEIQSEINAIVERYYRDTDEAPTICLLAKPLPADQMPSLYRAAGCFVLPTRGEGWNLPAFEALACGIPVITTAWSAHLDWLNENNAYLVDVETLEVVPRYGTPNDNIYSGYRWARPSKEHLRRLLRWVYEHQNEAKAKALAARSTLETNISWKVSAKRMYDRLTELVSTFKARPATAKHSNDTRPKATGTTKNAVTKAPVGAEEGRFPQVSLVIPSWGRRCGVAEYTKSLYRELKALGCEVKILGGPLSRLGYKSLRPSAIVHFQYEYSLYSNAELASLVRMVAGNGGYPLLTLHSFTDGMHGQNVLLQTLFPTVIVHADHTRKMLQEKGWRQQIEVIPMGVPSVSIGNPAAIRKELKLGPGPAIGFCGFMHWYKGILPLVQAVKHLRTIYPQARCYLFSGVSQSPSSVEFLQHFREQVAALGLEDVVVLRLAFAPEEKLIRYLNAMDVNVLPYSDCGYNSTSGAVRLLLAARKPIITTDVPFFADLSDEVVKISEGTPEAILDAIASLLDQPATQKALVERIARYARENTWAASAHKHYQLYASLLKRHS